MLYILCWTKSQPIICLCTYSVCNIKQLISNLPVYHNRRSEVIKTMVVNSLRPRQNGRHFADDVFKCIFLNENVWILLKISLKFVPKGPINNMPSLVQVMTWRRPGDKPLSEPMLVSLLTHISVTRPISLDMWDKQSYYLRHPSFTKYNLWFLNNNISTTRVKNENNMIGACLPTTPSDVLPHSMGLCLVRH